MDATVPKYSDTLTSYARPVLDATVPMYSDTLTLYAIPVLDATVPMYFDKEKDSQPTTSDHINIKYIWGPHVNHMGTPR